MLAMLVGGPNHFEFYEVEQGHPVLFLPENNPVAWEFEDPPVTTMKRNRPHVYDLRMVRLGAEHYVYKNFYFHQQCHCDYTRVDPFQMRPRDCAELVHRLEAEMDRRFHRRKSTPKGTLDA